MCGHLPCDRDVKIFTRDKYFLQPCAESARFPHAKIEDQIKFPIYKNYLKINKKNPGLETVKLLEANVGANLHDLELGNRFLDIKSKA